MPLYQEPIATGVTLKPGPVTPDFHQAVDRALADIIPPGRTGAVIFVGTQQKIVAAAAARIDQHWVIGGDVEKIFGGPLSGQVFIKGSW